MNSVEIVPGTSRTNIYCIVYYSVLAIELRTTFWSATVTKSPSREHLVHQPLLIPSTLQQYSWSNRFYMLIVTMPEIMRWKQHPIIPRKHSTQLCMCCTLTPVELTFSRSHCFHLCWVTKVIDFDKESTTARPIQIIWCSKKANDTSKPHSIL